MSSWVWIETAKYIKWIFRTVTWRICWVAFSVGGRGSSTGGNSEIQPDLSAVWDGLHEWNITPCCVLSSAARTDPESDTSPVHQHWVKCGKCSERVVSSVTRTRRGSFGGTRCSSTSGGTRQVSLHLSVGEPSDELRPAQWWWQSVSRCPLRIRTAAHQRPDKLLCSNPTGQTGATERKSSVTTFTYQSKTAAITVGLIVITELRFGACDPNIYSSTRDEQFPPLIEINFESLR